MGAKREGADGEGRTEGSPTLKQLPVPCSPAACLCSAWTHRVRPASPQGRPSPSPRVVLLQTCGLRLESVEGPPLPHLTPPFVLF